MKSVGALLILGACMALAAVNVRDRRRRLSTLDGLAAALGLMDAELAARAAALPELTAFLSTRSTGGAACFFRLLAGSFASLGERPFYSIWTACVKQALPELHETERRALLELGRSLGRYSVERQREALCRCRECLQREAASARTNYSRDRQLICGLSFACGTLLLILLL